MLNLSKHIATTFDKLKPAGTNQQKSPKIFSLGLFT